MTTVLWGHADTRRRELEDELERLVALLRALPGVRDAWVFGSVASGKAHDSSDLDLLVVRDTDEADARYLLEGSCHATACCPAQQAADFSQRQAESAVNLAEEVIAHASGAPARME